MVSIGMIFQYDGTEGTGLIMLSGGVKIEFGSKDWVDSENTPSVGQKISYENNGNKIKIKVAADEDQIRASSDEETKGHCEEASTSDTAIKQFDNADDYIDYYTKMGFKLVKDIMEDESRTVTLRMYTADDYGEAVIRQTGSKITVRQSINGKTVVSE